MAKMAFMRQGYHDDMDRLVRNLEHRRIAHAAVDAFFDQLGKEHLEGDALRRVVAGAKCLARAVWDRCVDFLYELTERHAEARQALLEILANGRAAERWQVVASLGFSGASRRLGRELVTEIVRRGLADRSARVRTFALDRALMMGLRELLPLMSELATNDPDERVRDAASDNVRLLRDGYIVRGPEPDSDMVLVDVAHGAGGLTGPASRRMRWTGWARAKWRR